MLKAFVLCESITDSSTNKDQKDLLGAGLSRIKCSAPFPVKLTFWVFVQLSDQKDTGEVRLALMRADSGRRYFFRPVTVRHPDTVQPRFSAFGCMIAYFQIAACTSLNC